MRVITLSRKRSENNYFTIILLLLISTAKWNAEAVIQSPYHLGLTLACRHILDFLDSSVYKDIKISGKTDITIACNFPGKNETITLPVNINTADQLNSPEFLDPNTTTVVHIYGFNDNLTSEVPTALANAYFALDRYNVLRLDYSTLVLDNYFKAILVARQVADIFAKFLVNLCAKGIIKPSKIHIIGMSLGSQTASMIARKFTEYSGAKLGRITGLDPSSVCYDYHEDKLTKKDAEYVDIIHANHGVEGIIETVGHADYFINEGGPNQPGCPDPTCSHKQAGFMYIESLNSNYTPFYGRKCDTLFNFRAGKCDDNEISVMGINSKSTTRGSFYFRTKNESPYSMGLDGTKSASDKFMYGALTELLKMFPKF